MSNPNKVKGTGYERELVKQAQVRGLKAKRAWGSNGEALGFAKEVDVVIEEQWKLQCKRHRKLPTWLSFQGGVHGVAFRENNGETFVMIPLDIFFDFLAKYNKV